MSRFPTPERIWSACGEIIAICHEAASHGLMCGFNGNASIRLNTSLILMTGSGVPKGSLCAGDLVFLAINGKAVAGSRSPSSEKALHLALYQTYGECGAIVHVHPPKMLALELALGSSWPQMALELASQEAAAWRQRCVFSAPFAPGSEEVAKAAKKACYERWGAIIPLPCAVWLGSHGLCALAKDCAQALALACQLEHISAIQLALIYSGCQPRFRSGETI